MVGIKVDVSADGVSLVPGPCDSVEPFAGRDEPRLHRRDVLWVEGPFCLPFEGADGGVRRFEVRAALVGEGDLEDPAVAGVRSALDHPGSFEGGQDAVHGLRGGVARAGEVGVRRTGAAREHAQHGVLR